MFTYLYLENSYNHKIIGDVKQLNGIVNNYNIGIRGRMFFPETLPESNEIVSINNVPFVFPDKSADKLDNVTCEGQILQTPDKKYSKISFLGFCEFGNFEERMILTFTDQSTEEGPLFFYDWQKVHNGFWKYDAINSNCNIAYIANISSSNRYGIYCYTCSIQNNSLALSCIELPYNPNMHILAVTLHNT